MDWTRVWRGKRQLYTYKGIPHEQILHEVDNKCGGLVHKSLAKYSDISLLGYPSRFFHEVDSKYSGFVKNLLVNGADT